MKKLTLLTALVGLVSTTVSHAATASVSGAASLGASIAVHPIFGILIPGLNVDVKTKTVIGWVFGLALVIAAIRVIGAMNKANDERDKEKRQEDIKTAWIVFISCLGVTAILTATGIISFTDMTSALNAL